MMLLTYRMSLIGSLQVPYTCDVHKNFTTGAALGKWFMQQNQAKLPCIDRISMGIMNGWPL